MDSMRLKTRLIAGLCLGLVAGIAAAWCSTRFPRKHEGSVLTDSMNSHYYVHAPNIDHGHVHAGVHGHHFEYETTWAGAIRDVDDPTDDHGHMVLFQSGHPPNDVDSDDRDVSSAHQGFAQFLICDGSVRAVSESIDMITYLAYSTRAGSE